MIAWTLLIVGIAVGLAAGYIAARRRRQGPRSARPTATHQILLPFTGTTVSRRALEAALRLARVEGATLMPAFLATVPRTLSLESALPRQAAVGMPLMEVLEQRAVAAGVAVDSRVERGRTYRHALTRLLETEQFDRVIVSATNDPRVGLSGDDILWVLRNAPAEVLILRPAPEDTRTVSATKIEGHF